MLTLLGVALGGEGGRRVLALLALSLPFYYVRMVVNAGLYAANRERISLLVTAAAFTLIAATPVVSPAALAISTRSTSITLAVRVSVPATVEVKRKVSVSTPPLMISPAANWAADASRTTRLPASRSHGRRSRSSTCASSPGCGC